MIQTEPGILYRSFAMQREKGSYLLFCSIVWRARWVESWLHDLFDIIVSAVLSFPYTTYSVSWTFPPKFSSCFLGPQPSLATILSSKQSSVQSSQLTSFILSCSQKLPEVRVLKSYLLQFVLVCGPLAGNTSTQLHFETSRSCIF